jgi:hypothetical protein
MPPPTTSTSNICAVSRSTSRIIGIARQPVAQPPRGEIV